MNTGDHVGRGTCRADTAEADLLARAVEDYDGYIFHVEKWAGSISVQRMSFAERGVYKEMLNQQWRDKHSLLDDAQAVADLIAPTPAHVAEVLAAWTVVRRKFVASKHASGVIYNCELEVVRRKQRAKRRDAADAGRKGGKVSAANRQKERELDSKGRLTTLEPPLNGRQAISKESKESTGSKESEAKPTGAPRRASRPLTVFDGTLQKDHAHHVFCSDSFSVCVPSQVHAKYLGRLIVARFHGDREAAHAGLKAWYATVAAALPPETVMGDAFKFWDAHFDGHWATPPPAKGATDEVMWLDLGKKGPTKRPYEVAK